MTAQASLGHEKASWRYSRSLWSSIYPLTVSLSGWDKASPWADQRPHKASISWSGLRKMIGWVPLVSEATVQAPVVNQTLTPVQKLNDMTHPIQGKVGKSCLSESLCRLVVSRFKQNQINEWINFHETSVFDRMFYFSRKFCTLRISSSLLLPTRTLCWLWSEDQSPR